MRAGCLSNGSYHMSRIHQDQTGATENYNAVNADWAGYRRLQQDEELVQYADDGQNRIWLNEQRDNYPNHWHAAMEIIEPLENGYDVEAAGKHFHLEEGSILIIPPRQPHALYAPPNGRRFIFLMDVSSITSLKGYTSVEAFVREPILLNPHTHPLLYGDISQILARIRSVYFQKSVYADFTILSLLLQMLVRIMESRSSESELLLGASPMKQQEYIHRFTRVLDYINGHYTENLTQESLAAYAGFSKSHFSRLFKQYAGLTPIDYLHQHRIKAAETLLEDPSLSITEAALGAGFSSIPTFNRLFRAYHGCSPREYRALHRGPVVKRAVVTQSRLRNS